jgi:hypothetical protein
MTKQQLQRKIARMETVQDHLLTELHYLDQLMKMIGFEGGLAAVKAIGEELAIQAQRRVINS